MKICIFRIIILPQGAKHWKINQSYYDVRPTFDNRPLCFATEIFCHLDSYLRDGGSASRHKYIQWLGPKCGTKIDSDIWPSPPLP